MVGGAEKEKTKDICVKKLGGGGSGKLGRKKGKKKEKKK